MKKTRRTRLAATRASRIHDADAARDDRETVGGADVDALADAAKQDGASLVKGSRRARAHVRGAPRDPTPPAPSTSTDPPNVTVGAPCSVYVADATGRPQPLSGKWCVLEVDTLTTSHDPRTFAPSPAYPAGVQERRYDVDKLEQLKVIRNAATLIPEFLINNNPDAVNGAPVCAQDKSGPIVVLGGNSRAMSLRRCYDNGDAAAYRALLVERSRVFGIQPHVIDAFKRPALVRVVRVERDRWQDMSRRLNEAQTQEKDATTDSVSLAPRLSDRSLDVLAAAVGDGDETLNAFLSSAAARPFVASLVADGVVDARSAGRYLAGQDLSEQGRELVTRVLIARAIPDATTIERMGPARREAVARISPAVLAAARAGHDIAPQLKDALDDLADADARGLSLAQLTSQEGMFAETRTRARGPIAIKLRALLERAPARVVPVVRAFAKAARAEPAGQGGLFGGSRDTAELFVQAAPL